MSRIYLWLLSWHARKTNNFLINICVIFSRKFIPWVYTLEITSWYQFFWHGNRRYLLFICLFWFEDKCCRKELLKWQKRMVVKYYFFSIEIITKISIVVAFENKILIWKGIRQQNGRKALTGSLKALLKSKIIQTQALHWSHMLVRTDHPNPDFLPTPHKLAPSIAPSVLTNQRGRLPFPRGLLRQSAHSWFPHEEAGINHDQQVFCHNKAWLRSRVFSRRGADLWAGLIRMRLCNWGRCRAGVCGDLGGLINTPRSQQ